MSELLIFICQFSVVFLLGVQSQMVRDSNCIGAAIGSLLIGYSQFYVFAIIGGLAAGDLFTIQGMAFILAGPLAIITSIKTHPHITKLFKRDAKKPEWPESEERIEAIGQNGGDGIHHKILNAGLYDT